MLPWASWLIELSSLSLAPLPAPEVPALEHHGKMEKTRPPCLRIPPFSQISVLVLRILELVPSLLSPRYQQGLTHSQNSRMEGILGGLCHSPSFQERNRNLERACGLSGVAQQVGQSLGAASAPQPRPSLASESGQKLHKIRAKGSFLSKEVGAEA